MQFNSRWWTHLAFFVSTFITALTLQTFRALKNNYDISLQNRRYFFSLFRRARASVRRMLGGGGGGEGRRALDTESEII